MTSQPQSQSQLSWVFLYVFNALNILTFFLDFPNSGVVRVVWGLSRCDLPWEVCTFCRGVNGFVNAFFLFSVAH